MSKDYWLYSAQAYTGVRFNVEKARELIALIDKEMATIKERVDPQLPSRPLKTAEIAHYRIPAKPFTKSGEYSAVFKKWLEKHSAVVEDGFVCAYGVRCPLEGGKCFL